MVAVLILSMNTAPPVLTWLLFSARSVSTSSLRLKGFPTSTVILCGNRQSFSIDTMSWAETPPTPYLADSRDVRFHVWQDVCQTWKVAGQSFRLSFLRWQLPICEFTSLDNSPTCQSGRMMGWRVHSDMSRPTPGTHTAATSWKQYPFSDTGQSQMDVTHPTSDGWTLHSCWLDLPQRRTFIILTIMIDEIVKNARPNRPSGKMCTHSPRFSFSRIKSIPFW